MNNENQNSIEQFVANKPTPRIETILSALNVINTALSIPIELPIAKKTIQFKQLTTAQEKRLIKDLLTNKETTFLSAIMPILKENCEDSKFDLEQITLPDLYAIILKIRIYSIGEEIVLKISKKKPKTGTVNTKIHLLNIYEQLISKIKKLNNFDFSIETAPYKIYGSIPKIKDIMESLNEENETFYDTLFIEAARMITKIELIANNGEKKDIDMKNFSFAEKSQILENLPNATLTKVYEKTIDKITELRNLILFNFVFEGDTYSQTIDLLSSDFFTLF